MNIIMVWNIAKAKENLRTADTPKQSSLEFGSVEFGHPPNPKNVITSSTSLSQFYIMNKIKNIPIVIETYDILIYCLREWPSPVPKHPQHPPAN